MAQALPPRPSLDWLRKTAKQALRAERQKRPDAKLAETQLLLAREFGFASWRALKAHLDSLQKVSSSEALDDAVVAQFLRAVRSGALDAVRTALTAFPGIVNAKGPHPHWGGRPQPLHMAIEGGQREAFDLLLAHGANVQGDNASYSHWTPLMLAISNDQEAMRVELLARGARPGLVEALMLADDAAVERILKLGRAGLPDYAPNDGSVLAFARTTFAIDRLLALGVDTETPDQWQTTPIEAMSRLGAKGQPLVRHLLARGLTAKPQEYARLDDRATLEKLIAADPQLLRNGDVLMGAVDFGHRELAGWLLALGADPNARSSIGSHQTPLHSAAWEGNLAMAKLLVAAGADIHARDEEHQGTPAEWARYSMQVADNPNCRLVAEFLDKLATS
jgi:ankyrin repeat protein